MSCSPLPLSAAQTAILLALALFAVGCPQPRGDADDDDTTEQEDDDDVVDDDDVLGDDDDVLGDDDDAVDDDDTTPDFGATSLTFEITDFTSTPQAGGTFNITGTWVFAFWEDQAADLLLCAQRFSFDASAAFGPTAVADCSSCDGLITVDEASVLDVSDPAASPDDCDPATIEAAGMGYGTALLTSVVNGGHGDFLTLALIQIDSFEDLGLTGAADGSQTAQDIRDFFADSDLEATHVGYVRAGAGSFSVGAAVDTIAAPANPGSEWHTFFRFYKDPVVNTNTGVQMNGEYGATSFWLLPFGE